MILKRVLARRFASLIVLGLVMVVSLLAFPSPRVHASGGNGDPCSLRAYYMRSVIILVVPSNFGNALSIHWTACDTHDTAGPFSYDILVEQTGEHIVVPSLETDDVHWDYVRPLIPEPFYAFRVSQCFSDGSCTLFSLPSDPASFPSDHHFECWDLHG